jgi:hypothetical protein
MKKRFQIVQEILQTEKHYVSSLKTVVQVPLAARAPQFYIFLPFRSTLG